MRGGRNKFGPMYKRDRARRLQIMRQRQLTVCGPIGRSHGGPSHHGNVSSNEMNSPFVMAALNSGQATIYSPDGIKQELIQIPQLSSSTSSPDSSPLPGQTLAHSHSHAVGSHFVNNQAGPGQMGHPAALGATGPGAHELSKWMSQPGPAGNGHQGKSGGGQSGGYHFEGQTGASGLGQHTSGPLVVPLSLTDGAGSGKVPHLMRELQMTAPDDKDWQSQLFGLLNNQTYNQCEVDLFELMCKVIDQSLFAQVDWARNSIFFKDLKVRPAEQRSARGDEARRVGLHARGWRLAAVRDCTVFRNRSLASKYRSSFGFSAAFCALSQLPFALAWSGGAPQAGLVWPWTRREALCARSFHSRSLTSTHSLAPMRVSESGCLHTHCTVLHCQPQRTSNAWLV